jgi:HNH endonuclease/AP2 domain
MYFKPLPSAEYLRELFNYDAETGELTWKVCKNNYKPVGSTAGYLRQSKSCYVVRVDRVLYLAHRLIWRMVTGDDPGSLHIDHIDCNPNNNALSNLRLATGSQNQCNRSVQSNNTSGFKGVSFDKRRQKYRAYIKHLGKQIYLGQFPSAEEAYAAYCSKAAEVHGKFARL